MPLYRSSRHFKSGRAVVAITIGDPSGIGPEVVLKALASRKLRGLADFLIIGDRSALLAASRRKATDLELDFPFHDLKLIDKSEIKLGRPGRASGKASLAYIDCALKLIKNKEADCLVTAPVSKEAISGNKIKFSGHTEYIAKAFKTNNFAMMLTGGPLRVTLVTRHLPIRAVPKAVTRDEILRCINLSYDALKRYFGIKHPRIAVASLNPHGGEGGSIGDEEERIIRPAVAGARRRIKDILGPLSSETLFYEAFRGRLDCIIAMYHDQGLTPLKMIARDNSINVTLGLPFIRTSPGHGTAFDIAGKGIANPQPMIEAIKLAIDMYRKKERSRRC